MGGGSWTSDAYIKSRATCGYSVTADGTLSNNYTSQDLFKEQVLHKSLNPKNVMRECCDSAEHPRTIPVILALDVTGSMGSAAAEVAKKLNEIMSNLYGTIKDVEFCVMGIGDLAYDRAPIQASQFESDVRIAEHLDKIYFEGGGGGNKYESYTAAWYFGVNQCKLDCWNRGKKGIIITLGDEPLNPYLPAAELAGVTGRNLQADVETGDLYKQVIEKFDVYHLAVNDIHTGYTWHKNDIQATWGQYLDETHLKTVTLQTLAQSITEIISNASLSSTENITTSISSEGITW